MCVCVCVCVCVRERERESVRERALLLCTVHEVVWSVLPVLPSLSRSVIMELGLCKGENK